MTAYYFGEKEETEKRENYMILVRSHVLVGPLNSPAE